MLIALLSPAPGLNRRNMEAGHRVALVRKGSCCHLGRNQAGLDGLLAPKILQLKANMCFIWRSLQGSCSHLGAAIRHSAQTELQLTLTEEVSKCTELLLACGHGHRCNWKKLTHNPLQETAARAAPQPPLLLHLPAGAVSSTTILFSISEWLQTPL